MYKRAGGSISISLAPGGETYLQVFVNKGVGGLISLPDCACPAMLDFVYLSVSERQSVEKDSQASGLPMLSIKRSCGGIYLTKSREMLIK